MGDETQEILELARDAAEAYRRAGRLSVNDYQAITSAIALLEITLHDVAALRADLDDAEARVRELEEKLREPDGYTVNGQYLLKPVITLREEDTLLPFVYIDGGTDD